MPILHRCAAILGLAMLCLFSGAVQASAHVRDSTGYSSLSSDGALVSYSLSLEYELLAKAVALGPDAAAAADDSQRQRALESGRTGLETYLRDRAEVFLDGARCEPSLKTVSIGSRDEAPYANLDLVYNCPGASGAYQIKYEVFAETDGVVDDHSNIVDYRLGGTVGRAVLDDSHREFSAGDTSPAASGARFGVMGFEHILSGLDHVLFVVALILGARSLRNLGAVISMFTLAHSLTLMTALTGWVNVPSSIVEPLIALSIAVVAIENLLGATARRLPVVFVFGLLHGLGFAGSLRVTDDVSWDLVLSLFSFNIGIEAGQLLLLAAVFPLILLVRRSRWSAPIICGATTLVAAIGLIWFVERFFLT